MNDNAEVVDQPKIKVLAIHIYPKGLKWLVTLNGADAGTYYLLENAKRAAIALATAASNPPLIDEAELSKLTPGGRVL